MVRNFGERGFNMLDYDLANCLEYNPQEGFVFEDVSEVLGVYEGENDGENWRWIVKLHDDRLVCIEGGCDYTGWD